MSTMGDKRTPHAAQPPTPRARLARGAPPEEDGAMLARRLRESAVGVHRHVSLKKRARTCAGFGRS